MALETSPSQREFGDVEAAIPLSSEFRYAHEPVTSETANRFVGREAQITTLLERIQFSEGGSFLVTGYRGVGKTSFVNIVIRRLQAALPWAESVLGPTTLLDVQMTVARPLSSAELMHLIIRRLYQRLAEIGILEQLDRDLRDSLILAYNRTSMNVARSVSESTETSIGLNQGSVSLSAAPLLIPFSWLSFNRKRSSSQGTGMAYLAYDDRSAEHDIVHLSRRLAAGYLPRRGYRQRLEHFVRRTPRQRIRLKIVFVFDELDKLDDALSDGSVKSGHVLDELLSTLKTLFTTSGISFIFVAGRDLQERWMSDLQRGDSIYESVFAHDLYIPCLWTEEVEIGSRHVVWDALPPPADPESTGAGASLAPRCVVCSAPLWHAPTHCPSCGAQVMDGEEAREVFDAFIKYLRYKGRGIPRRALREFNSHVRWCRDRPLLCFTPLDRRRFIAYGQLYDAIMSRQKQLFGAVSEETRGTSEDRRRLGVFYLCDWILRQGTEDFTVASAIASSRLLSSKIALAEELAPGVVKELIETLQRHEFVEVLRTSNDTVIIKGSNDGGPRYRLVNRRLIEMGLLNESFEPDDRVLNSTPNPRSQFGRFEIVRTLGSGGMGRVELAWDPVRAREVAIKTIQAHAVADPSIRQRFKREAEIMLRLSHPNIVQCYEVNLDGDQPFIVMDYIEGSPLRDIISESGPLPAERAAAIIRPVLDALAYLHRLGYVRNDIKPSNILIQPSGHVVLTDFGITKTITTGDSQVTGTGIMVGTPSYMAPEQITGSEVDERSDIYAVGAVLYEMLVGKPPFTAQSTAELLHQIVNSPPPPLPPDVPSDLGEIVVRCLAKSPAERYASASELTGALQNLRGSFDVRASDLGELVSAAAASSQADEGITSIAPRVVEHYAPPPPAEPAAMASSYPMPPGYAPPPPYPAQANNPYSGPAPIPPVSNYSEERDPVSTMAEAIRQPRLRIVDGGGGEGEAGDGSENAMRDRSFPLGDLVNVGRGSENQISIADNLVSRYHLRVSREGTDFYLEDLNTPNGTLLNGQRLRGRAQLTEGDLIQIGATVLQFQR